MCLPVCLEGWRYRDNYGGCLGPGTLLAFTAQSQTQRCHGRHWTAMSSFSAASIGLIYLMSYQGNQRGSRIGYPFYILSITLLFFYMVRGRLIGFGVRGTSQTLNSWRTLKCFRGQGAPRGRLIVGGRLIALGVRGAPRGRLTKLTIKKVK